ncbi:MAG: hypothetical protein GKR87_07975 [Kiritimatiellae bacterium]|nr:hypothetical protein [Kiritimatiellia bacterium]
MEKPLRDRSKKAKEQFPPEAEFPHDFSGRIEVSFIPEKNSLHLLVRKLHASVKAHPLSKLALIFLARPKTCRVKIEVFPVGSNQESSPFYQCKTCKTLFLTEQKCEDHILNTHMEEYYERKEKEAEPPKGNFVCIARCKLSGTLLGPPNYHGYAEKSPRRMATKIFTYVFRKLPGADRNDP